MRDEDVEQLDLLGIFHYIFGGVTALFSCIPLVHVFIGLAIVTGSFVDGSNGSAPPPIFGWMFVIMGGFFILCGWGLAICIILAGGKLRKRKNRMFCLVIAGIECLLMPFGTILGVLTLVELNKDSVKAIFDEVRDVPERNEMWGQL